MRIGQVTRVHPTLPIFRLEADGRAIFYAPGHVATVSAASADSLETAIKSDRANATARELKHRAEVAADAWRQLESGRYEPECLTLYLSNRCDLACGYCYAAADDGERRGAEGDTLAQRLPLIDEQVVIPAARLVAKNCAAKGKRLTLVLHGGGEPTLHWDLLQRVFSIVRGIAVNEGLEFFSYIATHGAIAQHKVRWLAENFSQIGLSCDGPPDVQNAQRPRLDGQETSRLVERTATILHTLGASFTVRATITPQTVARQAELVAYFHQRFGATDLRFEPVYRGEGSGVGGQGSGFVVDEAERFASHYLAAEVVARALGCRLSISGVRLDEIHGPFCNVLRQVLQLTPDGAAVACFPCVDGRLDDAAPLVLGRVDPATGQFAFDQAKTAEVRRRSTAIPARCHDCVNLYHCARDCPETCPTTVASSEILDTPGFRCRVQKILGQTWIKRSVQREPEGFDSCPLPNGRGSLPLPDGGGSPVRLLLPPSSFILPHVLSSLPPSIDAARLAASWESAVAFAPIKRRAMPQPAWATRGFEHDGPAAWREIRDRCARLEAGGRRLEESAGGSAGAPLSIYVHLPFCDRKCGFCDCYALLLDPRKRGREDEYTAALLREIAAWTGVGLLAERPVTTIHFGGGTPNYLRQELFDQVLAALRACFGATAQTEWALESTTSQLDRAHLAMLRDRGFSRLHIGIQTLEEPLRQSIGRKESSAVALEKLRLALDLGFIVSVDLIYGLPGQSVAGFVADLERLEAAGVHGFSLYQLNSTRRNAPFAREHHTAERDPLADYLLFQVGEQWLADRGFHKNHFAHFARGSDRNLYYTHAARGEDLLALGASADGILGDYRYRHPEYAAYVADSEIPSLEGGLSETAKESILRPLSAALMAANIERSRFHAAGLGSLLDRWEVHGLIAADGAGRHTLTANGSWFISTMLGELASTQPAGDGDKPRRSPLSPLPSPLSPLS